MPDLKDTYVVHCAQATCTMGMRPSYVVLRQSHGIFLRGQALMTVKDCKPGDHIICFGGCYSIENPSTIAAAAEIQKQVQLEAPDTFIDKVMTFFGGGKKTEIVQNDPSQVLEGMPQVVGECLAVIVAGQEWDNGKDGVETEQTCPLLGEAKIFCMYGGEIKLENAGQPEAGDGRTSRSNQEDSISDTQVGQQGEEVANINGVGYTEGIPQPPNIEFDNDFPYDSDMEPTKEDYTNYAKWVTLLNGADMLAYIPDGCKTYRHYLYGKGLNLEIDYEKAYRQDEGVRISVDNKINEGLLAATQYYTSSGKNNFSLTGGPSTSSEYPTTENWQKAIGGHTMWNSMDVSVENNQMTINITTHELDRYNFDKGKADVATGTLDNVNGRFASVGWANPFTTEGTIEQTITIDVSKDVENVNLQSSNVKIKTDETIKRVAPWEGENR